MLVIAIPAQRAHSWNRVDGIDLLRGIAILFVLLNHVNMRLVIAKIPYGQALPHRLLNDFVWNGQRGVQIFFAVSGFLIASTTLRRWGTPSRVRVRDFYLLRFARIAPLLILLLAVLSIFDLTHVKNFIVPGGLGGALLAALTFRMNLLLRAHHGSFPGNWYVLWSLSVEETFYFFFPLVCRWLGRGKLLIGLLTTFIVLGPFARTIFAQHSPTWQEVSYLGGMDAIALGCLTAILLPKLCFGRRVLLCTEAIGAIAMIWVLGFSNSVLARTGLDMSVLALGTCMVIVAVAQTRRRGPTIARPILWLGQRSYEVYLTHMFVVYGVFEIFIASGKPSRGIPALFIVSVILAGILGELVARFFSEPMNRWLRERWGKGPSRIGSVINNTERRIAVETYSESPNLIP
ncbi:MAG TPA: acyltransferase [Candidatus Acidoferrales bacterium]|nr:acyltransferase [Candidatus Acidoferrales bacterium]